MGQFIGLIRNLGKKKKNLGRWKEHLRYYKLQRHLRQVPEKSHFKALVYGVLSLLVLRSAVKSLA